MLFFNRVFLPDPDDQCLYADGELVWKANARETISTPPFDQVVQDPEFMDGMREMRSGWKEQGASGIIVPLTRKHPPGIAPAQTVRAFYAALSQAAILRSAIPDRPEVADPNDPPGPIFANPGIWVDSTPAPWHWTGGAAAKLPEVSGHWYGIAFRRLSRTLKYLRFADAMGSHPVTLDTGSSAYLPSLIDGLGSPVAPTRTQVAAALTTVINHEVLDQALATMPIREVRKLRSRTLPHMERLYSVVQKRARMESKAGTSDPVTDQIRALIMEFEEERKLADEAWYKLLLDIAGPSAIATVVAGAGSQVIAGQIFSGTVPEMLTAIVVAGAGTVVASKRAINNALSKRRTVRKHPMFFLGELPVDVCG